MAKKTATKHSDVDELADWVRDELNVLKDERALEILEIVKSNDPDKSNKMKERMQAYHNEATELRALLEWCENEPS